MPLKEWYKEWFNSPYYDILYYKRNEQEATAFIKLLISHLNPPKNSFMLDIACGKGRYSKVLADMGFDVTGIDISERAVLEEKKIETEKLHFFNHDMRLPFFINYFDYAFNFFTSFGYFHTDREHNNSIRTIAQSLKNNGLFIIDYLNVHYAKDNLVKNEKTALDEVSFHISRWQNDKHFFKQIQIEKIGRHNLKHLYTEKVAKFSLGDFTDMLAYQDMQVQEVFGDYRLEPYSVRKSPRMIIVAKKVVR